MSRSYRYVFFLAIGICFLSISCQRDNYEEPKLTPNTYSFNIPNRISFNFSQLSENRTSITPYSNTLVLKNISNSAFSGKYVIFAFQDVTQNYNNSTFIKHGNFAEIATDTISEVISLETSDNLFADDNLIASVLSFDNGESDHSLNGFYSGELNIFAPTTDEETAPIFIRSITCTGFIDFEGQFRFFVHNISEDNVVQLTGNFNSLNQVSGNILNSEANNLSVVINSEEVPFMLVNNSLTGDLLFTENSEARLLKFNLTKQN